MAPLPEPLEGPGTPSPGPCFFLMVSGIRGSPTPLKKPRPGGWSLGLSKGSGKGDYAAPSLFTLSPRAWPTRGCFVFIGGMLPFFF